MFKIDAEILYHEARHRHVLRRDIALTAARRCIYRPGNCAASIAYEQIRAWFDIWEAHLWRTYGQCLGSQQSSRPETLLDATTSSSPVS